MQIDPHSSEDHNKSGVMLAIQGKVDLAAYHFHKAVALLPSNAQARNNLDQLRKQPEKTRHSSQE